MEKTKSQKNIERFMNYYLSTIKDESVVFQDLINAPQELEVFMKETSLLPRIMKIEPEEEKCEN